MQIWAMVVLAILAFWWVKVIYNMVTIKPNAGKPLGAYIVFIVSAVILGIVWLAGGFN